MLSVAFQLLKIHLHIHREFVGNSRMSIHNYIDIILVGDEDAARNITFLEIPSLEEGYDALYNPGGPGTTPFSGVSYSQPGPRDLEPVIIALDDPMRVSN